MDIEMYTNRIATLTEKAKEASVRVIVTEANLTDLIVDGPEDDLARVRTDHQAAVIDRDALVRGLEEAEYHLSDAKTLADLDVVLGNCGKIEKLVKQRAKLQNEAEKAFLAFMDKIEAAEAVAGEIGSTGAGAGDRRTDQRGPRVCGGAARGKVDTDRCVAGYGIRRRVRRHAVDAGRADRLRCRHSGPEGLSQRLTGAGRRPGWRHCR